MTVSFRWRKSNKVCRWASNKQTLGRGWTQKTPQPFLIRITDIKILWGPLWGVHLRTRKVSSHPFKEKMTVTELKKHGFSVGDGFFPWLEEVLLYPLIEVFGLPCQGPSTFHLSNPLHPNISMYCSLSVS